MVTGVLEGLALVTASAKAIKSAINTVNSVGDLSNDLDRLFDGADQCQPKKKKLTKWEAFIQKKAGSVTSKLSIGTVAARHIEQKQAQESLKEMGYLINQRWGHGTFEQIEAEHAELVKKADKAASRKRKAKAQKLNKALEIIGSIIIVSGSLIGVVIWLQYIKNS